MKTVTIAIPAHNEEKTIRLTLQQIVSQHQSNFILEKIIVACDGCTDSTAAVVREFSEIFSSIEIIDDGKRYGKLGRLMQMAKMNESDIIIFFDADISIPDKTVIADLVQGFSDDSVGLVGGACLPVEGKTFFEKVVVATKYLWYDTRRTINHGYSIHNLNGPAMALSRELAAEINAPSHISADDQYIYLYAEERNYSFRFVESAKVYYRVPSNIHDYLKQGARFLNGPADTVPVFGEHALAAYTVPFMNKLMGIARSFVRNPFYLVMAIVFEIVVRIFKARFVVFQNGGIWSVVTSTKGI